MDECMRKEKEIFKTDGDSLVFASLFAKNVRTVQVKQTKRLSRNEGFLLVEGKKDPGVKIACQVGENKVEYQVRSKELEKRILSDGKGYEIK